MVNSLFSYLERLELMTFFCGYPLIFSLVIIIAGNRKNRTIIKKRLVYSLSFAYALTGILYWGLQIRNYYPDYSFHRIFNDFQSPLLKVWGLLSILFWLPLFSKRPALSLIHSLVFFFFLASDLFLYAIQTDVDKSIIKNDMKIFTDSLLINLVTYIAVLLFSLLYTHKGYKKNYLSKK